MLGKERQALQARLQGLAAASAANSSRSSGTDSASLAKQVIAKVCTAACFTAGFSCYSLLRLRDPSNSSHSDGADSRASEASCAHKLLILCACSALATDS